MACQWIAEAGSWLEHWLPAFSALGNESGWSSTLTAFALVAAAEFGDKSQLVCMTLAARHRHWPVTLGAVLAFTLLNAIAVVFGAAAARWIPERWLAAGVALLFAGFGLKTLLAAQEEEEAEEIAEKSGHGIFLTTFLMIFLAEFGDKTQLAVAALGAAEPPLPVWLGSTLALTLTSVLGIWAGRTLLLRISPRAIHLASGVLFIAFAGIAGWKALPSGFMDWAAHRWDEIIQPSPASRQPTPQRDP